MKVLSRGPNFAILPRNPPVGEYIASIENACMKLKQDKVDELRGEIKTILQKIKTPAINITKEEKKALVELRKDTSKTILTADKGVSLVVMNNSLFMTTRDTPLSTTKRRHSSYWTNQLKRP